MNNKEYLKTCPICGKQFSTSNKRRKTCSRECAVASIRLSRKKVISKPCIVCGKEFLSVPHKNKKTCSSECHRKSLSGEKHCNWKGGKVKKVCLVCGKIFYVKQCREQTARFCTQRCAREYLSGSNHPLWKGGKVTKICDQCGKEFKVTPALTDKSRFCSRKCTHKWVSENLHGEKNPKHGKPLFKLRGENNPNWKGGKRVIKTSGRVVVLARETPDSKGSYRYESRVVMESFLGRPLNKSEVVHHKDGNLENNVIENLMLFPNQASHARYHNYLKRGKIADALLLLQKMNVLDGENYRLR